MTRSKSKTRTRKTQRGGMPAGSYAKRGSIKSIMKGPGISNAVSKYLSRTNIHRGKIADLDLIDQNEKLDDVFQEQDPILEKITEQIDTQSLTNRMQNVTISGKSCSRITSTTLVLLSRSLCNVEKTFKMLLSAKYEKQYDQLAASDKWETSDKPDFRLYRLFYQIMTEKDLDEMIQFLIAGYDPSSNRNFLTEEHRTSRLGELVHSYKYKLFAGLATKYAMTETVLKYSVSPAFSDLRNLCLVMRDILGLVNHFFRTELKKKDLEEVEDIGDTQYCHSGGNMFYVMAMMLCYIHSKRSTVYDPNDILEQIRFMFDMSLGSEKDLFYVYLDTLMDHKEFRELLHSMTSSMSDLDFLCMTSNRDMLTDENRVIMKDVTYLMSGMLLEQCGKALTTGSTDNIALKVILPKRNANPSTCGVFKTSDRSKMDHTVKDEVNARVDPYLDQLHGIRLSANEIKAIHIFLIRIKVAMEQDCLSDELKRIFAEKLDFVVGSLSSSFYKYKQRQFAVNEYYSLETFLHELLDILVGSTDDKSDKRMDRYRCFNIMSYIEKHATDATDATVTTVVEDAIRFSKSGLSGAEPSVPKSKHWFSVLFGIIFQFLDPTKNRAVASPNYKVQPGSNWATSQMEMLRSVGDLGTEDMRQRLQDIERRHPEIANPSITKDYSSEHVNAQLNTIRYILSKSESMHASSKTLGYEGPIFEDTLLLAKIAMIRMDKAIRTKTQKAFDEMDHAVFVANQMLERAIVEPYSSKMSKTPKVSGPISSKGCNLDLGADDLIRKVKARAKA